MDKTILYSGLACIIAAIVGGGVKAFGVEIPLLSSLKRQSLLAIFGCVLVVISLGVGDTSRFWFTQHRYQRSAALVLRNQFRDDISIHCVRDGIEYGKSTDLGVNIESDDMIGT